MQINVVAASTSPAKTCSIVRAVGGVGRRQPECDLNGNGLTPPPSNQTSPCPVGAICSDVTSGACPVGDTGTPPNCVAPAPGPSSNPQACSGCTGNDGITYSTDSNNPIVELQTTLKVPSEPPPIGAVGAWPGLQPSLSSPPLPPIGVGVLQPVLVWGGSCTTPNNQPAFYSTWWISGQYYNPNNDPGLSGCLGGSIMSVNVGDSLAIDMKLNGQTWTQTITDAQTGKSVNYSINLQGQAQYDALFTIEEHGQKPVSPVVFTNSSYTSSVPQTACNVASTGSVGTKDIISPAVLSSNGLTCSIQSITLYGVPQ